MRYLGIDYGSRRTGIAISDEEGRIAFPLTQPSTLSPQLSAKEVKKIIKDEGVSKIIVGLPLALNGRETIQTKEVRAFVVKLKKMIKVPIEFENEMLTTKIAENKGVKKNHVDAAAAAIILQSYLDKINHNVS